MTQPQRSAIPTGPKLVVGLTTVATLGAIVWSHYSQVRDKQAMKEGVKRDKERIKMRRMMRKQKLKEEQAAAAGVETAQ